MSSGSVLDQTSTVTGGSSVNNTNNAVPVNNNSTAFQPVRHHVDSMGHPFENSIQIFGMKQQPMTSPVTGTIYTGPPAKYFNNGNLNSNGYATGGGGPMRPMLPPQGGQNRYGSYNGNGNNNGSSMQQQQQQRRQNTSGVDNATNDSIKYEMIK